MRYAGSCRTPTRGPENPNWKGGTVNWPGGYLAIRVDDGDGGRKYVLQHRRIMESHLGRELLPTETVHHKNGDKADNRIENLELPCTCFQHD
jgi:hypothetical protein